ncbi:hypothetical protein J6590_022858 [Homalodisca vitripennis]|nr:hypothetical protein J6590_022858 [Homalodisca vitripennis]
MTAARDQQQWHQLINKVYPAVIADCIKKYFAGNDVITWLVTRLTMELKKLCRKGGFLVGEGAAVGQLVDRESG